MTETAQYADVILPGVSYAEKEGTFTNTERRVRTESPQGCHSTWRDETGYRYYY